MRTGSRSIAVVAGGMLIAVSAGRAEATGFALAEQSARGLGAAFAGSAALADDVTTIWTNPAGLARVRTRQFSQSFTWIKPHGVFDGNARATASGPPLTGGDGGDAGSSAYLPTMFVGMPIDEKWSVGLSVTAPFGLSTTYSKHWMGRYHGVDSDLLTINVQPTLAYRIDDQWSVGAGFDVQYVELFLTSKVDLGTLGAAAGLTPTKNDGHAKFTGDDTSLGWNAGVLYEHDADTRVGLTFRSKVSHKISGDTDFDTPRVAAPLIAATGAFTDTDSYARSTFPESAALAVWHRLDEKLAVMGELSWTRWSRFRELRIKFDNPAQPDAVDPQNWDDTFKLAVGAQYAVNDKWDWRAGFALDQTPTNTATRGPRLPDQDHLWVAFGFTYHYNEDVDLDFGYAHIYVKRADVHLNDSAAGSRLDANFDARQDIFAISATVNF